MLLAALLVLLGGSVTLKCCLWRTCSGAGCWWWCEGWWVGEWLAERVMAEAFRFRLSSLNAMIFCFRWYFLRLV